MSKTMMNSGIRLQANSMAMALFGAKKEVDRIWLIYERDAESLNRFDAMYLCRLLRECGMERALKKATADAALCRRILREGDALQAAGYEAAAREAWQLAAENVGSAKNWGGAEEMDEVAALCAARLEVDALTLNPPQDAHAWRLAALEAIVPVVMDAGSAEESHRMSECCGLMSMANEMSGNLEEAVRWAEQMAELEKLTMSERAWEGNDENFMLADPRRLAGAYRRLGVLRQRAGDLKGAIECCDRAKELLEIITQHATIFFPEDHWLLALVYANQGDLAEENNAPDARKWYDKALEVADRLAAERGMTMDVRLQADLLVTIGQLEEDEGRLAAALRCYSRAAEKREMLLQKEDDVDEWCELAESFLIMGAIEVRLGRLGDAQKRYEKALKINEELVTRQSDFITLYNLAQSHLELAELLDRRGSLTAARRKYEKALALFESLEREEDSLRVRCSLALTQFCVAANETRQGRRQAAEDWWERAKKSAETLLPELEASEEEWSGFFCERLRKHLDRR